MSYWFKVHICSADYSNYIPNSYKQVLMSSLSKAGCTEHEDFGQAEYIYVDSKSQNLFFILKWCRRKSCRVLLREDLTILFINNSRKVVRIFKFNIIWNLKKLTSWLDDELLYFFGEQPSASQSSFFSQSVSQLYFEFLDIHQTYRGLETMFLFSPMAYRIIKCQWIKNKNCKRKYRDDIYKIRFRTF